MNDLTQRPVQLIYLHRFRQVPVHFFDWCGEAPVFCTWGAMDLTELQRNLSYYGMQTLADGPFPFLDVQKLFSIGFEDRKSRRSFLTT